MCCIYVVYGLDGVEEEMSDVKFTRLKQSPNKMTFKMPKLRKWLIEHCEGSTLNLFAGEVRLEGVGETRVDIDMNAIADYHMDAYDFVVWAITMGWKYNTVVLDPPYNKRKAREKYNGHWIGKFTKVKNLIPQIVADGGRVITFGYSSVGMSKSRGFELEEICLICHSGDYSDTIVTVERKI